MAARSVAELLQALESKDLSGARLHSSTFARSLARQGACGIRALPRDVLTAPSDKLKAEWLLKKNAGDLALLVKCFTLASDQQVCPCAQ